MRKQLFELTQSGIYIPDADVYIDPWKPVKKAIITHAHADHAHAGNAFYLSHHLSKPILKYRLGDFIQCETLEYGEMISMNGVKFSLHPAGHIPGSAQIRIEKNGQVLVVSGDYKIENDLVCTPFELIKCHSFISESTFGLPIFKWEKQEKIFEEIHAWWKQNISNDKTSILLGYALGKSQRLLKNLDPSIGKIFAHGAVYNINELLRNAGVDLPYIELISPQINKTDYKNALILAPSSVLGSPWLKKFYPYAIGNCSGWMQVRGNKRRQAIDRGFVMSDHADWDQLNATIKATGAENVFITHGYSAVFVKWLNENGVNAFELETEFIGDESTDEAIAEVS